MKRQRLKLKREWPMRKSEQETKRFEEEQLALLTAKIGTDSSGNLSESHRVKEDFSPEENLIIFGVHIDTAENPDEENVDGAKPLHFSANLHRILPPHVKDYVMKVLTIYSVGNHQLQNRKLIRKWKEFHS